MVSNALPKYFRTLGDAAPTTEEYSGAYSRPFALYVDFLSRYGLDKSKIWDTIDRKSLRDDVRRKEYVHASLQNEAGYNRWLARAERSWFS